jgi:hypothetical protein
MVLESPNPASALGWLRAYLVHTVTDRTAEVIVPLCPEHGGYFRKRTAMIYLPIALGLLGQVGGVLILGYSIAGGPISSGQCGLVGLLGVFGLLAALVASSALERTGIRAVEITGDSVHLAGVSEEFAAVVADCRAGDDNLSED